MIDVKKLEARIGYLFKDRTLAETAFTHSSYTNEHADAENNERLEFLGDGVLNFLAGERLFVEYPRKSEGELSKMRAARVSKEPLARLVDKLGLLEFLRVGAGVDKSAMAVKSRSNPFEALLGAVYLDGGMDACRALLDGVFYRNVTPEPDYKTDLQELATARGLSVAYATAEIDGGFECTATVGGEAFYGKGRKKHDAEIAAAKSALDKLRE